MFRTLGHLADKHWTVYQKFFYRAAWSLKELCTAVLIHVIYPLIIESGVLDDMTGNPVADLAIDDTTVARCGKHVAHAGWFKDASTSGSSHKGTVIHWAHNWLVGAITLRLPRWAMIRWVFPVAFSLYRKPADCTTEEVFRTRQELAGEMIQQVAQALPEVQLRVSADGQYAKRQVVRVLPHRVNLVSRIRRDAAIYQLPSKRKIKGKRGRKPKKGKRMPTPKKITTYRKEGFREITVQKQGYHVKRMVLGITFVARYRFEWSSFETRPERKRMTFSFVPMPRFRMNRLSSGIMIAGVWKNVFGRQNSLWDLSPRMAGAVRPSIGRLHWQ
jgi:hypothetical protein